jgi:multidrug transporter EmrE-like cation transporter
VNSNPVFTVALFAVYTVCTSAGLLVFKYGWPRFAEALQGGQWLSRAAMLPALGAMLYVTSFILWLVIVSRMPLTVAYPLAIGLSLLLVTAGAVWWLGEALTPAHAIGGVLVLAGVVFLSR